MLTAPKSSAPIATRHGSQVPNTTSASAIQPRPAVMFGVHCGV